MRVPRTGLLGYEAIPTNEVCAFAPCLLLATLCLQVIDLDKRAYYPADKFFRPVQLNSGCRQRVTLEKDRFYILATKERISVPLSLSAEMVPFSQHVGELRAHYAGFL